VRALPLPRLARPFYVRSMLAADFGSTLLERPAGRTASQTLALPPDGNVLRALFKGVREVREGSPAPHWTVLARGLFFGTAKPRQNQRLGRETQVPTLRQPSR
jgi:hypothetical protein